MSRMLPVILGLITAVVVVIAFDSRQPPTNSELMAFGGEKSEDESTGLTIAVGAQQAVDPALPPQSVIVTSSEVSLATPLARPTSPRVPMQIEALRQQISEMSPEDPSRMVREPMLRMMEGQVTYLTGSGLSQTDAERIVDNVVVEIAECRESFATQVDPSDNPSAFGRQLNSHISNCRNAAYQRAGLLGYQPAPSGVSIPD